MHFPSLLESENSSQLTHIIVELFKKKLKIVFFTTQGTKKRKTRYSVLNNSNRNVLPRLRVIINLVPLNVKTFLD